MDPGVESERADSVVVLVHIPKTAGTTLGSVLRHHYGGRFERVDVSGMRVQLAGGGEPISFMKLQADAPPSAVATRPGTRAISGHLPFGLADRLPAGAIYLAVLRDPVERTLSQYFHLIARKGKWTHDWLPPPRPDLTLGEAIGQRAYIADNLQTRMLCGLTDWRADLPTNALERAKQNLRDRFAYVGTTERFDEFLALLNLELDWPTFPYESARVNAGRPRAADLPPEDLRAVEGANVLDRELHVCAEELLSKQVARLGSMLRDEVEVLRESLRGGSQPPPSRAWPLEARVALALAEAEQGKLMDRVETLTKRAARAEKKLARVKELHGRTLSSRIRRKLGRA